jgi:catechol 2,3-dioxygenase-like lactoylglutathione lyase family enzyme
MPGASDSSTSLAKAFHLSLNVRNLAKSVDFYQSLLGIPPAKSYADYAKFELSDPALVLSLEPTSGNISRDGTLNHLGIRLAEQQLIREYYERAAAAGIEVQWMSGVECCYSRQSKIVAQDPDGNLIEFYTLDADLDHGSAKSKPMVGEVQSQSHATVDLPEESSWTHLLGTELTFPLPLQDSSQTTINLRGTLNNQSNWEERQRLLTEVRRALKDNGKLSLHLLVADRPLTKGMPTLPAPAQHVQFVPVLEEVIDQLSSADLSGIYVERLSHAPVFAFDGVEMRELLLTAVEFPRASETLDRAVVYRGPMREVTTANGSRLRAGTRSMVSLQEWEYLKNSPSAEQYVFLVLDSKDHCGG